MQLDTDYLENQRRSQSDRWRQNLAALALIGCAIMLGDLVVAAQSVEAKDDPVIHCPQAQPQPPELPLDISPTLALGEQGVAFKFVDRTLCSDRD